MEYVLSIFAPAVMQVVWHGVLGNGAVPHAPALRVSTGIATACGLAAATVWVIWVCKNLHKTAFGARQISVRSYQI